MAHRVTVSLNYATHLPALMRAVERTTGPVLELGMGVFSTPYLHYKCLLQNRYLLSVDNDASWVDMFLDASYYHARHNINTCQDWDQAIIEEAWDVALIDHSPGSRRVIDIKRLANSARYIVLHDTNARYEREYGYSAIYPLFRYRTDWTGDGRHAAVLSNFVDLGDFWK